MPGDSGEAEGEGRCGCHSGRLWRAAVVENQEATGWALLETWPATKEASSLVPRHSRELFAGRLPSGAKTLPDWSVRGCQGYEQGQGLPRSNEALELQRPVCLPRQLKEAPRTRIHRYV